MKISSIVMAALIEGITWMSNTQALGADIYVNANQPLHQLSPYLTGSCIEDVNHEIYGGLYSQMIFGESFQEPGISTVPLAGFTEYGGTWLVTNGVLFSASSPGPKLMKNDVVQSSGDLKVQLQFPNSSGVDAGFIFQVTQPGLGADVFTGYEVSLSPSGYVVLGRHRQNWEQINKVTYSVPTGQWITLEVLYTNASINVLVNSNSVMQYTDTQYPLTSGQVGLRNYQQDVRFQNFQINGTNVSFAYASGRSPGAVSGMWTSAITGTATGQYSIETSNVFVGMQSQRLTFTGGAGEIGVANRGLNRWGMNFVASNIYEGCLDVRADTPTPVMLALESADGLTIYAQTNLLVTSNNWQHLNFTITPSASDTNGRFVILLTQPGSVVIGYAFLQPGEWGRFQGLPVRKDVVEGLINQGVTVLRYGGSMVNASGYRWKNMVEPRDQRPPYTGTWYPYSSDGWGIPDFLNFCEAAGFLGIPDFNINETSQDMADFIQYVNGSTNTVWGAQRAADGHPAPYNLKYLELGNEEAVNSAYYQKFQALAQVIWAADPNIIIVVGDFSYGQVISNPFSFSGAASGITTLAAQQQILQLAKQYNREVWFDVHVWDDGPSADSTLAGMFSYDDALGQIANGAAYKVVVFELNANHHNQGRALGNALAINAAERDGRLPIMTSANCLQPDGENDNGWDQGLLFLNSSQVWLQPPGYVTKMYRESYQPLEIWSRVADTNNNLDVSAQSGQDGKNLVLKVVNNGSSARSAALHLLGFNPTNPIAVVNELSASLGAVNTAQSPLTVTPVQTNWQHNFANGVANYTFAPYSVTTIIFQGNSLPLPLPVLRHRYSFDGPANSTTITDSVGGHDGVFFGSSGGQDGNGNLVLNGTNGYADLGPDLITGYTNLTVEAWVNVATNDSTYARLFNFGDTDSNTGSGAYGMDFCPHANLTSWFEAFNSNPGTVSAQQILGSSLSGIGLVQIVVVYDPGLSFATVYTNGALATSGSINIPISALVDAHNYIGKSGYNNDPYLTGTLDEFRVYSGDMNAQQVAADYSAGPNNLITNVGSLTNITLKLPALLYAGQTVTAVVTADYQNAQSVTVAYGNVTLQSGNANVIQVGTNLTLNGLNDGTVLVTASFGGLTASQTVTVIAPPATVAHRYNFDGPANSTTFTDLVGNANGTIIGNAHLDGDGHLILTGGTSPNNTNYAALPPHLLDTNLAFTIEAWVSFGNNPTWARFIGFGDTSAGNGVNYTDFIPKDGFHGDMRWETGSFAVDQVGPTLNNTANLHLVLVYNNNPAAHYMAVYTNGVLMGANYSITSYTFNMTHCCIGKSSYSGDPNGVFTLDELRIYNGAMPSWQLAENDAAGPDVLPDTAPTLTILLSGDNVILNWPVTAAGYGVQASTTLGTGALWTTLPASLSPIYTNNTLQMTLPVTNQALFYRLVK